jgi:magnesium-transporting ATPase (P-type)
MMVFRHFSIGGKEYRGEEIKDNSFVSKVVTRSSDSSGDMTLKNEKTVETEKTVDSSSSPEVPDTVKLTNNIIEHYRSNELQVDLKESVAADPNSPAASHARTLNGFFTVLSLCHTVLAAIDPKSGIVEYKAQSPDEAALVRAAADVGFVFRGRDKEILRLQTPFVDHVEEYELLNVLEFNSTRKRMSVIVRKLDEQDSRIFLLCKGADNVSVSSLDVSNSNGIYRSSLTG